MDEDTYHGLMYNIMYYGNYVTVQAEAAAAAAEDAMKDVGISQINVRCACLCRGMCCCHS